MAVALLALFVALGGTSYAVSRIDGAQLKNATVSGKKLRKNTLGHREIRESALTKVPVAKRADNATHATTAVRSDTSGLADRARSADAALSLSDGAVAGLTIARSGADPDNTCHPLNTVDKPFLECASVTIGLPRAGRVLLVGTGGVGVPVANVPFIAGCQLQVDGVAIAGSLTHAGMDMDTTPGMHFAATPFGIATTAVSDVVGAGAHTFAFACQQSDPDVVVVDAKISAVMVGAA